MDFAGLLGLPQHFYDESQPLEPDLQEEPKKHKKRKHRHREAEAAAAPAQLQESDSSAGDELESGTTGTTRTP